MERAVADDTWRKWQRRLHLRARLTTRTVKHGPLTIKHEALTIKHEALTVKHEALTIKHGALTVKHEPLTVKHEALTIKHEALRVKHEALAIKHGALTVKHGRLTIKQMSTSIKFLKLEETIMNQTQTNRGTMFKTTVAVLKDNQPVWSGTALFVTAVQDFINVITAIDQSAQTQETPTIGAAVDKHSARESLEDVLFLTCQALGVIGHNAADNDLVALVDLTPSSVHRRRRVGESGYDDSGSRQCKEG